jgi:hypothetical protein
MHYTRARFSAGEKSVFFLAVLVLVAWGFGQSLPKKVEIRVPESAQKHLGVRLDAKVLETAIAALDVKSLEFSAAEQVRVLQVMRHDINGELERAHRYVLWAQRAIAENKSVPDEMTYEECIKNRSRINLYISYFPANVKDAVLAPREARLQQTQDLLFAVRDTLSNVCRVFQP